MDTFFQKNDKLKPEIEVGNMEYKLNLTGLSPEKFGKLATQMKFRLEEGQGEAVYELGIADNGEMIGITSEELKESLENLEKLANDVNAVISPIQEKILDNEKIVMEVLVRYDIEDKYIDIRIPFVGNVDCLDPLTPVLMFDGTIQEAKYIKIGDKIMGDDFTERNVLSTSKGIDEMYNIYEWGYEYGNEYKCIYTVNSNHILSLIKDNDIIDIHIKNYLYLSLTKRLAYSGYRVMRNGLIYTYDIYIEPKGKGEFYGFRLDGNRRFILGDYTVTHNSGKSTLIGTLTRSILDNGRGHAREYIFVHPHEIESGRTSSIAHHILGFDARGKIVNSEEKRLTSWIDIVYHSRKIITFYDLAGHEKYLKTTIFGLSTSDPDYLCMVIDAKGMKGMSKEHLGLCLILKIPIFIVITKIDDTDKSVISQTIENINLLLKGPGSRKMPLLIQNDDDVYTVAKGIYDSDRTIPIFRVSNVTGEGLDFLRKFLNIIPKRINYSSVRNEPVEFHIDCDFTVKGWGCIVGGILKKGCIKEGDTLYLGPFGDGSYKQTQIKSIQCKKMKVKVALPGRYACLCLRKINRDEIKSGMVVVDVNAQKAIWTFTANITVIRHSTSIRVGYEPIMHIGTVRQVATIKKIDNKITKKGKDKQDTESSYKETLRSGDNADVSFRFRYAPCFVSVGDRFVFREGSTRGLGKIIEVDN